MCWTIQSNNSQGDSQLSLQENSALGNLSWLFESPVCQNVMCVLHSNQEEADTCIVLHDVSLSNDHTRFIIRCDNADVLVILAYNCSRRLFAHQVSCTNNIMVENRTFQHMRLSRSLDRALVSALLLSTH